jgi:polyhydroxyalkanoate synthesis regulator phasin
VNGLNQFGDSDYKIREVVSSIIPYVKKAFLDEVLSEGFNVLSITKEDVEAMVDEAHPVGGIYLKVGFEHAGEVMGVYPGENTLRRISSDVKNKNGENYPAMLHHKACHVVKGQITRGELEKQQLRLLVESFCATVLTESTNQTLEESGQRRLSFAQMKFFNIVACGAHR